MSLEQLNNLVENGEKEKSEALVESLLGDGVDPVEILQSLTVAMERVGDRFARLDIFLPEVMLAGEALMAVVDIAKPRMLEANRQVDTKGSIVLGVARGDLHHAR